VIRYGLVEVQRATRDPIARATNHNCLGRGQGSLRDEPLAMDWIDPRLTSTFEHRMLGYHPALVENADPVGHLI
jgi:hypothetical protein